VTAQYDAKEGGIKLTNANGSDIKLGYNSGAISRPRTTRLTAPSIGNGTDEFTMNSTTSSAVAMGRITFDSDSSFSLKEAPLPASRLLAPLPAPPRHRIWNRSPLDITTFDGAQKAIKIADAALSKVNGQRAQYGALQSRFDSAISNLQSTTENLSASKSRITDTDFASETANMTRGQILQQAGTSMLAQANSLPNGVLSLLRG
jgi:flagellin